MTRLNCRAGYTTDTRCHLKLLKKGTKGEFGETFENVFKWLKMIFSQKKTYSFTGVQNTIQNATRDHR